MSGFAAEAPRAPVFRAGAATSNITPQLGGKKRRFLEAVLAARDVLLVGYSGSDDLDIVPVQEVGLREVDDSPVLEWAAREERIVVTHDVSTFADFAYERVAAGLPMPGVIEIPESVPRSVIIDELILIAGASEPNDWESRVVYLPLR